MVVTLLLLAIASLALPTHSIMINETSWASVSGYITLPRPIASFPGLPLLYIGNRPATLPYSNNTGIHMLYCREL